MVRVGLPKVTFSQKLMALLTALTAYLGPSPRILQRRRHAFAHLVAILVIIIVILVVLIILTI